MKLTVNELKKLIEQKNIIPSKDNKTMALVIVGEIDNNGDVRTSTLINGERADLGAMLAGVMVEEPQLETLFGSSLRACRMCKSKESLPDPLMGLMNILQKTNGELEEYMKSLEQRLENGKKKNKPKK